MASVASGTDSRRVCPVWLLVPQSGCRRQLAAETMPAGSLHMYDGCTFEFLQRTRGVGNPRTLYFHNMRKGGAKSL